MNKNFEDMMEANSHAAPGKAKLGEQLHHVEIVHHMTSGEMRSHSFMPHEGKEMASHMADCPQCSGMTVKPDTDSAAGAAT